MTVPLICPRELTNSKWLTITSGVFTMGAVWATLPLLASPDCAELGYASLSD